MNRTTAGNKSRLRRQQLHAMTVEFPNYIHKELVELARQERCSMASLIRHFVEFGLTSIAKRRECPASSPSPSPLDAKATPASS